MQPVTGISVVIPNYNGVDLLPQILPAAEVALQATRLPFEIIVADDASTDLSISLLQQKFPSVKIESISHNGGFSKTANRGIQAASYPWVLLLNSDVKLTPNYFEQLLPYTAQTNCLGVTARIVGWNDETIQDGGKYPVFQGAKIKTSYDFIPIEPVTTTASFPCFYLSGANAFLNRAVFLKIGGFNELFSPFYIEDTELCLRAWRLGYASFYEHRSVCRHRTSSTLGIASRKKEVQRVYNRNKYLLHAIHLDGIYLFSWMVQLKFELIFRLLTFRWQPVQSFVDFLKLIPAIRQSRKNLRNLQSTEKLKTVPALFSHLQQQLNAQSIELFKR
ncbi:MAG: hypothetical protein RLZ11_1013 [Bacteroidota bacterium]